MFKPQYDSITELVTKEQYGTQTANHNNLQTLSFGNFSLAQNQEEYGMPYIS